MIPYGRKENMENINWEFLIQAGILVSLVYLIFQVKEVVATLENHFVEIDSNQSKMIQELKHIESNQKLG